MSADRWELEALAATVAANPELGRDADMPRDARFLAASSRLVRRAASDVTVGAPAVFILQPENWKLDDPDYRHAPFMDRAADVTGRVWVSNEATTNGHFLEHSKDDATLVSYVVDELGLGDYATVVFHPDPGGGELRFYPSGLSDLGNVTKWPLGALAAITMDDVLRTIDRLHADVLISPNNQTTNSSTWIDSSRWYPVKHAEAAIQSSLRIALKFAFPLIDVQQELDVYHGRFDLAVRIREPSSQSFHWLGVLELKVVKSFTSTGSPHPDSLNRAEILKGVRQAFEYRGDLPADWAVLCCFDMRKDDDSSESCFDEARGLAAANNVTMRRWRMVNSADALRNLDATA